MKHLFTAFVLLSLSAYSQDFGVGSAPAPAPATDSQTVSTSNDFFKPSAAEIENNDNPIPFKGFQVLIGFRGNAYTGGNMNRSGIYFVEEGTGDRVTPNSSGIGPAISLKHHLNELFFMKYTYHYNFVDVSPPGGSDLAVSLFNIHVFDLQAGVNYFDFYTNTNEHMALFIKGGLAFGNLTIDNEYIDQLDNLPSALTYSGYGTVYSITTGFTSKLDNDLALDLGVGYANEIYDVDLLLEELEGHSVKFELDFGYAW